MLMKMSLQWITLSAASKAASAREMVWGFTFQVRGSAVTSHFGEECIGSILMFYLLGAEWWVYLTADSHRLFQRQHVIPPWPRGYFPSVLTDVTNSEGQKKEWNYKHIKHVNISAIFFWQ